MLEGLIRHLLICQACPLLTRLCQFSSSLCDGDAYARGEFTHIPLELTNLRELAKMSGNELAVPEIGDE